MLTPCPPAEVALEDTAIEAVALSASGETLVSAAAGALQLWDLTELVRRRLQGTSGRTAMVAGKVLKELAHKMATLNGLL